MTNQYGMRPDYQLRVKPKNGEGGSSNVGVAWRNDKGINIRLNAGVHLDWRDDLFIGLYPLDSQDPKSKPPPEGDDFP